MDILSRRSLIKTALGLPFLVAGAVPNFFKQAITSAARVKNNLLAKLYLVHPIDKTDQNRDYLKDHDFTAWHSEIHPLLRSLPRLNVPDNGPIIELGVHLGVSSKVLKSVFDSSRYLGVDIAHYNDDPQVIREDIRTLKDLDNKAALVWNDISTWEGSPRSRLAAFKWANRNLRLGGIYIDEGANKIPADLDFSGFKLLHKGKNFTVFRKV